MAVLDIKKWSVSLQKQLWVYCTKALQGKHADDTQITQSAQAIEEKEKDIVGEGAGVGKVVGEPADLFCNINTNMNFNIFGGSSC